MINDANTVLYLPCDTGTGWVDQSVGHTVVHTPTIVWRPNLAGTATLDAVVKKYGAASAKFVSASSQYLYSNDNVGGGGGTYTSSKRWAFGTDPFTIGFWYNPTTHVAGHVLLGQCVDVANRWIIFFNTNYVQFFSIDSGIIRANYQYNWAPVDGTWYWLEFARDGANFYMSVDGFMQPLTINTPIDGNTLAHFNTRLQIGRQDLAGTYFYTNGHIDDLFIDKGRALHTSDFAPPQGQALITAHNIQSATGTLMQTRLTVDTTMT